VKRRDKGFFAFFSFFFYQIDLRSCGVSFPLPEVSGVPGPSGFCLMIEVRPVLTDVSPWALGFV